MQGEKSWKEHKHHQRQAEEKKFRTKKENRVALEARRDYDNYPSANIVARSSER